MCLHVLDLPDEAEWGSLTAYWFRTCLLLIRCVKYSYVLIADISLKHLCADTPFFLLIVGAGRSRAIITEVLVVTRKLFLFSPVLPCERCSKFCWRFWNFYIIFRYAWFQIWTQASFAKTLWNSVRSEGLISVYFSSLLTVQLLSSFHCQVA